METLITIVFFCAMIYFMFRSDMTKKETELKKTGGIKTKYAKLIAHFDDFDYYNPPQVLENQPNYYQMAWGSENSIASITLFEMQDKLYIEYKSDYNIAALKRLGVDYHALPPVKNI